MDIRNRLYIVDRYKEFRKYRQKLTDKESLILLSFMFELTSEGFEQYIRDYFKEIDKCDIAVVTGGFTDGGIDVKCKKDSQFMAIQCKKFGKSHVTEKEILYFIENTKSLKKRLGDTLSLYFITTNRVNPGAWERAKRNGIKIMDYKDILMMNKKLDIEDFLKKNKGDNRIISGTDIYKILDIYYHRKARGHVWGDIFWFIEKNIISKFIRYSIDYEKVEDLYPEDGTNIRLLERTPIFDRKLAYDG